MFGVTVVGGVQGGEGGRWWQAGVGLLEQLSWRSGSRVLVSSCCDGGI